MTTLTKNKELLAKRIWFKDNYLHCELNDGRQVGVPLEWFPVLQKATTAERENWRLIGQGIGIHWEDLDEDISIKGLLEH